MENQGDYACINKENIELQVIFLFKEEQHKKPKEEILHIPTKNKISCSCFIALKI